MSCPHCLNGSTISCVRGGNFGDGTIDGGQGQAVRVPLAGITLRRSPALAIRIRRCGRCSRSATSWRPVITRPSAAECGAATPSPSSATAPSAWPPSSAALGADRIIALSRHPDRQVIAKEFGATDIVEARRDAATEAVMEMHHRHRCDASLECAGTAQAIATAFAVARPGLHGGDGRRTPRRRARRPGLLPQRRLAGRPAPAHIYIPELLEEVLDGTINPGLVLDYGTDLDHIRRPTPPWTSAGPSTPLIRIGSL